MSTKLNLTDTGITKASINTNNKKTLRFVGDTAQIDYVHLRRL